MHVDINFLPILKEPTVPTVETHIGIYANLVGIYANLVGNYADLLKNA